MIGTYFSLIVFHPKHPTEMMPVVVIEPTTQRCIQPVVAIVHGEDSPSKPVVHGFLSHQIAFLHPFIAPLKGLKGIFHQLSVGLVLLIIAIALGIMEPDVQIPLGSKGVVEEQLIVLLRIIIGLVIIEMHGAILGGIHISARIILPPIQLHFFFRGIVPGMIGFLPTGKGNEFNGGIVGIIGTLQIVGVQAHRGTVNVSVGPDIGQAEVECPMVLDQSRTHLKSLFMRIKRAIRAIEFGIRLHRQFSRLHIDACPEGTGSVGRCTRPTLHLHILDRRGKVGQIHPKHIVTLGIVHRYPVGGYINACAIRSAHSNRCIAYACPCIAGSERTGCHAKQIRQVLPHIPLFQFFFPDVRIGYRSGFGSTSGYYFNFLQVNNPQGVGINAWHLSTNRCCHHHQATSKDLLFHDSINSLRRHYPDQVQRVCSQPVMLRHPIIEISAQR